MHFNMDYSAFSSGAGGLPLIPGTAAEQAGALVGGAFRRHGPAPPAAASNGAAPAGSVYDGFLRDQSAAYMWDEHFAAAASSRYDRQSAAEGAKFKDFSRRKTRDRSPNNVQDLYKTELCNSFTETGSCPYGANCQFAHGPDELRAVARHPKYKTKACRNYAEKGSCPYGSRCRFIHGDEDESFFDLEGEGMGAHPGAAVALLYRGPSPVGTLSNAFAVGPDGVGEVSQPLGGGNTPVVLPPTRPVAPQAAAGVAGPTAPVVQPIPPVSAPTPPPMPVPAPTPALVDVDSLETDFKGLRTSTGSPKLPTAADSRDSGSDNGSQSGCKSNTDSISSPQADSGADNNGNDGDVPKKRLAIFQRLAN
mmetsp:Transcript_5585/g.16652  ORF Transcript_5585/g.16652 Transcript_5585/m.16652 type:complete len:364 (+) Transcript_5585:211-1302(+)